MKENRDKNGHTKEERDSIHALFDELVELWEESHT